MRRVDSQVDTLMGSVIDNGRGNRLIEGKPGIIKISGVDM
jgi:hypothetical protein